MATVATGMPLGICTMDNSESNPLRFSVGMGTPITGRQHSGKMGGPAGARNDDLNAPVDRLFRVGEETIGSPMGGDHQELVGNA